jgi:hypothetical protein
LETSRPPRAIFSTNLLSPRRNLLGSLQDISLANFLDFVCIPVVPEVGKGTDSRT